MNRLQRAPFLDLDGCFADLEGWFLHSFGMSIDDYVKHGSMWEAIDTKPRFFEDLPILPGARAFFDSIAHMQPIFLTCCPPGERYGVVARQKKAWVRRHFGPEFMVIPACGHLKDGYVPVKQHYMQRPGDILIDDYGKNCVAWSVAGGIALKHDNWPDTAQRFWAVINREVEQTA